MSILVLHIVYVKNVHHILAKLKWLKSKNTGNVGKLIIAYINQYLFVSYINTLWNASFFCLLYNSKLIIKTKPIVPKENWRDPDRKYNESIRINLCWFSRAMISMPSLCWNASHSITVQNTCGCQQKNTTMTNCKTIKEHILDINIK